MELKHNEPPCANQKSPSESGSESISSRQGVGRERGNSPQLGAGNLLPSGSRPESPAGNHLQDRSAVAHTPGPWRIGASCGAVVADHPIPEIRGSEAVEHYGGHLVAESIAPQNRPLIASAPDLLAALQESNVLLEEFLDEWRECEGELTPTMEPLAETIQRHAGIIAAAEGRMQ